MKISVLSRRLLFARSLTLTLALCRSARTLTRESYASLALLAQIACYLTLKIIQLHYTGQHPTEYPEMEKEEEGKKRLKSEDAYVSCATPPSLLPQWLLWLRLVSRRMHK